MKRANAMSKEEELGLEDLADIEVSEPPKGWLPLESQEDFGPRDEDDDADG